MAIVFDGGKVDPLIVGSVRAVVAAREAPTEVGSILHAPDALPSPQVLQALQRREQRIRMVEERYGLLTEAQVAAASQSIPANAAVYVDELARQFALVYEMRGSSRCYPGVQFDGVGKPRRDVSNVVGVLRELGWSDHSVITWLTTPNPYLSDGVPGQGRDSPVEVLPSRLEEVLHAARHIERV